MTDQITSPQQDQEEDALSLCDLPIHGTLHSSSIDGHKASNDEPFEFFPSDFSSQEANHVLFCGKIIRPKEIPSYKKEGTALGYGRLARHGSQKRRSRFKWCFFLVFGLQKFSAPKMTDLADMRNRLSRRSPKSLEEMFEKSTSYNSQEPLLCPSISLVRGLPHTPGQEPSLLTQPAIEEPSLRSSIVTQIGLPSHSLAAFLSHIRTRRSS
ncbi:hypothetical protein Cgig2_021082 [Carnegiea gigantea]|uniref:Uncharacterized protein n=1 Tax=Carnegiea gigantea TaxID=171969 RepID=A0A9Q1GQT3_9CARY|nr:hypothetical protein Cgig2_021082 [Carnegiea gigantea]